MIDCCHANTEGEQGLVQMGEPLQLAVTPQPRPDKQVWVQISVQTPVNFYAFSVPPDMAETMADELPEILRNAVSECKRQMSGIVIAQEMPKEAAK